MKSEQCKVTLWKQQVTMASCKTAFPTPGRIKRGQSSATALEHMPGVMGMSQVESLPRYEVYFSGELTLERGIRVA